MYKIGYTNDGKIFMVIYSTMDGKPTETLVQWDTSQARELCQEIAKATTEAESRKVIQ